MRPYPLYRVAIVSRTCKITGRESLDNRCFGSSLLHGLPKIDSLIENVGSAHIVLSRIQQARQFIADSSWAVKWAILNNVVGARIARRLIIMMLRGHLRAGGTRAEGAFKVNDDLRRELLAELIGTFVLVFVGSAAVLVAPEFGVVVPALAHGFDTLRFDLHIRSYIGRAGQPGGKPGLGCGRPAGLDQDCLLYRCPVHRRHRGGRCAGDGLPAGERGSGWLPGRKRLQLWSDDWIPHCGLSLDGGCI